MLIRHKTKIMIDGKEYECGRPFVQARCPSCGKMVGFQIRKDNYWLHTEAQTFCSEECIQASRCSWDLRAEMGFKDIKKS